MEIRKLNSLRGIAVLIVMISHYSNETGILGGLLGAGAGQLGVMLFFLLSAFLMAHLYLVEAPTASKLKKYAVARFARVVPLYFLVVFICFAAKKIDIKPLSNWIYGVDSGKALLEHLLFLRGDGVLWTIPPEIHFYLLFAIAWVIRPLCWSCLVVAIGLVLVGYFGGWWPHNLKVQFWGLTATPIIIGAGPYFIVGAVLGYLFDRWQPPASLRSHWFALSPLLILFLYPDIFVRLTGQSHAMWSSLGLLVAMSGIFFAVAFLVPANNLLLENSLGDKLGSLSYSLYLLHYPLLHALKNMGFAIGLSGLLIFLILSLLLAAASFALFEAPARRLIRERYLVEHPV